MRLDAPSEQLIRQLARIQVDGLLAHRRTASRDPQAVTTVALEQQRPVDVQVGLEVGAKGVRDGECEFREGHPATNLAYPVYTHTH